MGRYFRELKWMSFACRCWAAQVMTCWTKSRNVPYGQYQSSSKVTNVGICPWSIKSILFSLTQHRTCSGSSSGFCACFNREAIKKRFGLAQQHQCMYALLLSAIVFGFKIMFDSGFNIKRFDVPNEWLKCLTRIYTWMVRPRSSIPFFKRSRNDSSPFLDI